MADYVWHNIDDTTMRHCHHSRTTPQTLAIAGIFGFCLAASAGAALAAGPPPEAGLWYNHSGKGAVEIRPCGESGSEAKRLCGFIVWLRAPNGRDGKPLTDGYNSNPAKRGRPICGLPVLGDLQRSSAGGWDFGWVYDPEQGASFDAAIEAKSKDRLVLTGYKGVRFFSKSFVWKRAPDDLPRCDGTTSASQAAAPSSGSADKKAALTTPPLPEKAAQARAELAAAEGRLIAPRPVPAVRPSVRLQ